MRIFVACLSKVGVKGGGVGVGNPGDLSLNCHLYLLYRKYLVQNMLKPYTFCTYTSNQQ